MIRHPVLVLRLAPLTSAVCTTGQIRKMAVEMFEAEAADLPGFE